jgi:hypothetical protein
MLIQLRHRGLDAFGYYPVGRAASDIKEALDNPSKFKIYVGDACENGHPVYPDGGKVMFNASLRFVSTRTCCACTAGNAENKSYARRTNSNPSDVANMEARRRLEAMRIARECGVDPADLDQI